MLAADHCGEKKLIHVTAPIPDEPLCVDITLHYIASSIPLFYTTLYSVKSLLQNTTEYSTEYIQLQYNYVRRIGLSPGRTRSRSLSLGGAGWTF